MERNYSQYKTITSGFQNYDYLSSDEVSILKYDTVEVNGEEIGFYYYMPDNIDSNNVCAYTYLNSDGKANSESGLPIANYLYESIYENDPPTPSQVLTIIPDYCANSYDREEGVEIYSKILEKISNNTGGLTIIRSTFSGFSKTADEAVYYQAYFNSLNNNSIESVVVICDGSEMTSPDEFLRNNLYNTTALIFHRRDNTIDNYYDLFKNAILFDNNYYTVSGSSYDHARRNLITQLDGVSDFALGLRDLNNIGNYTTIKMYNKETGQFEEINYEYLKEIIPGFTEQDFIDLSNQALWEEVNQNVNNLESYIAKYNDEYLNENVAIIKNKINSLMTLCCERKSDSFASTTTVPEVENTIIGNIISVIRDMLYSITNVEELTGQIGESKVELENAEASNVEILDIGQTSFIDEYKG